jgi:hypothetical protein
VLSAVISRLISIMIPDVVSPFLCSRKRELMEAIANAYAALEAGATHVDTSVVRSLSNFVCSALMIAWYRRAKRYHTPWWFDCTNDGRRPRIRQVQVQSSHAPRNREPRRRGR